jgi:ABC-type amino acid transport system permease subunit
MEAGPGDRLVFHQRMAYVLIPQATRRFIPPFINSVVDAVKGSALCRSSAWSISCRRSSR